MSNEDLGEYDQVRATIAKLNAETANLSKKTKWYEFVLMGSFIIGLLAAGKYLL